MGKMTHEEYVKKQEIEVVRICNELLIGSIDLIWASRMLCGLGGEICEDPQDPDFILFVVIDSDTDYLPSSVERHLWHPGVLEEKDREIKAVEEFYRDDVVKACNRLIERFG